MKHTYRFLYSLILMFALSNCSDPEATPPADISASAVLAIQTTGITPVTPTAINVTQAGDVVESSRATALLVALHNNGSAPDLTNSAITHALNRISNSQANRVGFTKLSNGDYQNLEGLTPAQINAFFAGTNSLASYQSILNIMKTHTYVDGLNQPTNSYFTTFSVSTFSSADNFPDPMPSRNYNYNLGFTGSDNYNNCFTKAQNAFKADTAQINSQEKTNLQSVNNAYNTAISVVNTNFASCNNVTFTTTPSSTFKLNYDRAITGVNKISNNTTRRELKGLVNAILIDYVNSLRAANNCTTKKDREIINADVAKALNLGKVYDAYKADLVTAKQNALNLYNSCHNQGAVITE